MAILDVILRSEVLGYSEMVYIHPFISYLIPDYPV